MDYNLKNRLLCGLIFLFLSTLPELVQSKDNEDTIAIKTPDEAVKRALEYTGFEEIIDTSKLVKEDIASLVIITDDETPFLHDKINNRDVWQVTFDSVYLNLSGWIPSVYENQKPKTYKIYLDPENGKLLKIEASQNGEKFSFSVEPSDTLVEKLLKCRFEIYHDFPEIEPNTNFLEALDAAFPSSPIMSKKLIAYYVIHTCSSHKEEPVWIIIGRGIPGLQYNIDSNRSIVVDKTGKLISYTNYP